MQIPFDYLILVYCSEFNPEYNITFLSGLQFKMGARQSKRSVDISTTPKKDGESPVLEGEGKIEKIGELDAKITNGDVHKEVDGAVSKIELKYVQFKI